VATPNPGGFYYAHPIYWSRWRLSRLQAWSRTISRACSRHKCAPGEAGFEVAQRAITTPGILLQYPTPRLPRTSISKIVLPKSSSSTTVTSRNSRRHASSGRSPVLTANMTESWSCSASQLNPFPFDSCGPLSCRFVELLISFWKLVRGGVRGLGLLGCWEDREGAPEGIFFFKCLCEYMRLQDVETV